jgi:DNA-binding response OmpR family regulator
MVQPAGRRSEANVLIVASEAEVGKLRMKLPDLSVERVEAADAAGRALASRPGLLVWLGGDLEAGLGAIVRLRAARSLTRSVFVTPRSAEETRLLALHAGADEVLSEPVSATELAARIRIQLRRSPPGVGRRLAIAERLELDLDRQELMKDGERVHLRPKEARLLELFARAPGMVLSRDHILEHVWGPRHAGDPRTVDVHVRWLRAKIEPDPHAPIWLRTVRGVGYRLEGSSLTER